MAKYRGFSKEVCLNMEEEDRYKCENYFELPYMGIFFETVK